MKKFSNRKYVKQSAWFYSTRKFLFAKMKRLIVWLFFLLQCCVIHGNVSENCKFDYNLTSTSFEYRCINGSYSENCPLPDDIVQSNFKIVTQLSITDCPLSLVKKSYTKYKNLQAIDLSNNIQSELSANNFQKSCDFTYNLTSTTFEYQCEKGWFDDQCELPDDIVKPDFDAIIHLKITDCPLIIVRNSYKKYWSLQSLDLSETGYDSMDLLQLDHQNLQKLNISHNKLTNIITNEVPNFKEIDSSYNNIQSLDVNIFISPWNVEVINMSHNLITEFPYFSSFERLKTIDLSYNRITNFSDKNFDYYSELIEIYLNNNTIDTIDLFGAKGYIYFINWDSIVALNIFAIKEVYIILDSKTERIVTESKKIELHFTDKQGIANLRIFNGSNDRRTTKSSKFFYVINPTKCTNLALKDYNIGKFESNTFEKFISLDNLDLRNSKLTQFDFALLENTRKLRKFDISDNKLNNVPNASYLKNLSKISRFIMRNCHVTNTIEIIGNLSGTLKELDVSDNFIGQLKPETFSKLGKLCRLNLRNTSLFTFDFDPFRNFRELRNLDISFNNNLENQNFEYISSTLKQIKILNAEYCHIKNGKDVIRLLDCYMEEINLNGNFIGNIEPIMIGNDTNTSNESEFEARLTIFDHIPLIEKLNLANTNLTTFNNEMFRRKHEFNHIDISGNKLKE